MRNSVKLLVNAISSKKGRITRQRNKQLQLELSHKRAFFRLLLPLKRIVGHWDKTMKIKKYFRPFFKNYGLYNQGKFLLEIGIKKEESDIFGVFITWNIIDAKIGLALHEISRSGHKTIIGDPVDPLSFNQEMQTVLKKMVTISEKMLLQQMVNRYPIEGHKPEALISVKVFDMTGEGNSSSKNEWERACLELSTTGYFDGSENLYDVLAKAEEELLVNKQKVAVLGTNLSYCRGRRPKDEEVENIPTRILLEKIVTIGYLRRLFFSFQKVPFTLEWHKDHSDWRMANAMVNRNRAPIIIGAPR